MSGGSPHSLIAPRPHPAANSLPVPWITSAEDSHGEPVAAPTTRPPPIPTSLLSTPHSPVRGPDTPTSLANADMPYSPTLGLGLHPPSSPRPSPVSLLPNLGSPWQHHAPLAPYHAGVGPYPIPNQPVLQPNPLLHYSPSPPAQALPYTQASPWNTAPRHSRGSASMSRLQGPPNGDPQDIARQLGEVQHEMEINRQHNQRVGTLLHIASHVPRLNAEKERLEGLVKAKVQKIRGLRSGIEQRTEALQNLRSAVEAQRREHSAAMDECDKLADERDKLTCELNKVVEERNKLTDERDKLAEEREKLVNERSWLVKMAQQQESQLNAETDRLREEGETLSSALKAAQAVSPTSPAYAEVLAQLDEVRAELQAAKDAQPAPPAPQTQQVHGPYSPSSGQHPMMSSSGRGRTQPQRLFTL